MAVWHKRRPARTCHTYTPDRPGYLASGACDFTHRAEDIIVIGQELQAAKKEATHGKFEAWLAAEFDMSRGQAARFMQVAEQYGKSTKLIDLPLSALYLLAAPASDDVREEVTAKVEAGEVAPTHAAIKEAVESTAPHS